MGFFSNIFGAKETIGAIAQPIEAVGSILDNLFTSDEEELNIEVIKARLAMSPTMAQIELNKVEAQHRSIFVAGWRPYIGWVCGTALAYNFIVRDIVAWIVANTASTWTAPPELAIEHLITVLMGLLGLGTLRTVEKIKGKAK